MPFLPFVGDERITAMNIPVLKFSFGGGLLALVATMSFAQSEPRVISPRVIDEPVWAYPPEAAQAGLREGEARAVLSINEEGKLTDFIVVGWTHPAFGYAVANALPSYRFKPALVRSEPSSVRMPVTFFFEQRGAVVSMTGGEHLHQQFNNLAGRPSVTSVLCPEHQLDRPLATTHVVSPHYPNEMRSRGEPGSVTIDFYIDGEGKVRLPAAGLGTHPSFGRAAVAALEQWRFEPPTSQGRPVVVRASQVFNFEAPVRGADGAE
jgi:TonB family protein